MIGFRISRDFMLALRQLAGITAPLPADEARAEAAAELAYWRESVRFALAMLENKSVEGAKANLRALVADEQCYDCRTNGQQIKELEDLAMNVGAVASNAMDNIGIIYRQVDEMRTRLEELEDKMLERESMSTRLAYLERTLEGRTGPEAGL